MIGEHVLRTGRPHFLRDADPGESEAQFSKRRARELEELGYDGPLTIEREIPQDPERQKAEIGQAIELLTSLRGELLNS